MLSYLSKRLLLAVPTIGVVSVLVFLLSRSMPGDPVENILVNQGFDLDKLGETTAYNTEYDRINKAFHFDKALFYISIHSNKISEHLHYPSLSYNGFDNQYHLWLKNLFAGNLGNSILDSQPVLHKIGNALGWSIGLSFAALGLVILLGIPLGVFIYQQRPKLLQILLYLIYSIPVFWMATLLLTFFTTPEYGSWTNLFPSPGIWPEEFSWFEGITQSFHRLILPVLCIVAHDLSYIARLTSSSMQAEYNNPYIKTAISKGLSEKSITQKHILPNAFLPIITLIIDAIPRSLAGTLIIEVIFNLPGMGRLLFDSIRYQDWNVLLVILLIISSITVIVYILGDLIYAKVNPKIELQ